MKMTSRQVRRRFQGGDKPIPKGMKVKPKNKRKRLARFRRGDK